MRPALPIDPLRMRVKQLASSKLERTVYRLALNHMLDTMKPIGFKLAPTFARLPGEVKLSSEIVRGLIVEPFRRKIFPAQRWNPATFRCFYSALERETAVEEVAHYARKRLLEIAAVSRVYYVQIAIQFSGKIVDIHDLMPSFPELFEDSHHPKCHVVAEIAFRRRIDALLAPSVRRNGGKCLAVYRKHALTAGDIQEEVTFLRDSSGKFCIERNPLLPSVGPSASLDGRAEAAS